MSGSFSVGDRVSYSGLTYIVLSNPDPDLYSIARTYSVKSVESFFVSGDCLAHLEAPTATSYSVVNTDDLPGSRTLEEAREYIKELLNSNPTPSRFTIVVAHEAWESKVTIKQIK